MEACAPSCQEHCPGHAKSAWTCTRPLANGCLGSGSRSNVRHLSQAHTSSSTHDWPITCTQAQRVGEENRRLMRLINLLAPNKGCFQLLPQLSASASSVSAALNEDPCRGADKCSFELCALQRSHAQHVRSCACTWPFYCILKKHERL